MTAIVDVATHDMDAVDVNAVPNPVLTMWRESVPEGSGGRDTQLWAEDAWRVYAARSVAPGCLVRVVTDEGVLLGHPDGTTERRDFGALHDDRLGLGPIVRLGRDLEFNGILPTDDMPEVPDPTHDWWTSEAARLLARRDITSAGFWVEYGTDAAALVGVMDGAFVKTTRKGWAITVDPGETLDEALARRGLDWEPVRLEGRAGSVLVSPLRQMNHEYRLFVVGHRLVTGAGCIVSRTPSDHDDLDDVFDQATQRVRGDGEVVRDVRTVARIVDMAKIYAKTWARERPEDSIYVLDIALINGLPGVVEMNPLPNSGMYACDAMALARARLAQG